VVAKKELSQKDLIQALDNHLIVHKNQVLFLQKDNKTRVFIKILMLFMLTLLKMSHIQLIIYLALNNQSIKNRTADVREI
jgi:hypothetical protein